MGRVIATVKVNVNVTYSSNFTAFVVKIGVIL